MPTPKRRTKKRSSPAKATARIRGERAVSRTTRTVPVAPARRSRAEKSPMPIAAVDQRKQILEG